MSDTSPTAGSHPRDSRGLVQASLAAPEEISSAVLEAADMAVPTTAPMVLLSGAGLVLMDMASGLRPEPPGRPVGCPPRPSRR